MLARLVSNSWALVILLSQPSQAGKRDMGASCAVALWACSEQCPEVTRVAKAPELGTGRCASPGLCVSGQSYLDKTPAAILHPTPGSAEARCVRGVCPRWQHAAALGESPGSMAGKVSSMAQLQGHEEGGSHLTRSLVWTLVMAAGLA